MPPLVLPRLLPVIRPGVLNFPTTSAAKSLTKNLLEQDRDQHHCFFGRGSFHNHLSHHILAAFDLGAPPTLLQAIYDDNVKTLRPINVGEAEIAEITSQNWKENLGIEKYYASYLSFFTLEIVSYGVENTIERFLFNSEDGSHMLPRFVGGAFHPFIQTGYGAEFGSEAMIAQGLAQAAAHKPFLPELLAPSDAANTSFPAGNLSLFEILRQVYDSEILKPVMPYDPDAFISKRFIDASKDGRVDEIRRISALWFPSEPLSPEALAKKVEELFWVATLLFVGSGKRGRKPRLDFFLMHVLNACIFFPSILKAIPNPESKLKLLKAYLPTVLMYLEIRGRPRIDPELMMSYTATPHPPPSQHSQKPDPGILGDPADPAAANPWTAIIDSTLHAPDAHTVKVIRALFYAAKHYGATEAGEVVGAGNTHKGIGAIDGTVFVRAAGVVMETMGWLRHGQAPGSWDRSALGWEDAWKDGL